MSTPLQVSKRVDANVVRGIKRLEEKAGLRLTLIHTRLDLQPAYDPDTFKYSGFTRLYAEFPGGDIVGAESYCLVTDQFDRARGTEIAFDRLVHKISAQWGRDRVKSILED